MNANGHTNGVIVPAVLPGERGTGMEKPRELATLIENEAKQVVRLQEATLDIYGQLGFLTNRPTSFATDDVFGVPSQQGLVYHDSTKRGDLLPVYINEWQLKVIRQRSRQLCYFNEFALCGLENRVNYVVGEGLTYVATPLDPKDRESVEAAKLAQGIIDLWQEVNDLSEFEADTMRRLDMDGEAIIRIFPDEEGICHLRHVEPDHLRSPTGGDADPRYSYGVIADPADIEKIDGYAIVENPHVSWESKYVDASEVLHIKLNVPRNTKRGCPTYFPVHANLTRCEELLQSMTHMAKVRAKLALIRKLTGVSSTAAQALVDRLAAVKVNYVTGEKDVNVEMIAPGTVPTIPANMEVEAPHPNIGASDFVEVLQAELRAVASRMLMPEWMFTALADAKYSNAFVVESPALKMFKRLQKLITGAFGTRRYKARASLAWRQLRLAARMGMLPRKALALIKVECKGPPLETRDKAAETTRAVSLKENRLASRKTLTQELGYDPDEELQQIASETVGERRPVGDMKEVVAIQKEFYSGTLPKEAAINNVRLVLGYNQEQAEALFPGEPTPQPAMGGLASGDNGLGDGGVGGGGGIGGDGGSDGATGGPDDPQGIQTTPGTPASPGTPSGNPLAAALGITEQYTAAQSELLELHLSEAGFTGRIVDSRNRVYYYVDGKRVKGAHADAVHGGNIHADKQAAKDAKAKARDLHKLAVESPHLLTDEHMAELPKLLSTVPVGELRQMAKHFNEAIKGKLKDEHIADFVKKFPVPKPVQALMQQTDAGKAYLARLADLEGATLAPSEKVPEAKGDPGEDLPPSMERERRAAFRDDSDSIGRERVAANKVAKTEADAPKTVDKTPPTSDKDITSSQSKQDGISDTGETGVNATAVTMLEPTAEQVAAEVEKEPRVQAARRQVAKAQQEEEQAEKEAVEMEAKHKAAPAYLRSNYPAKNRRALAEYAKKQVAEKQKELDEAIKWKTGFVRSRLRNEMRDAANDPSASNSLVVPPVESIPATRPDTSDRKGVGKYARAAEADRRMRETTPREPEQPVTATSELSSHRMAASAGLAGLHRLTQSERDSLRNAIRSSTDAETISKISAQAQQLHDSRKGVKPSEWQQAPATVQQPTAAQGEGHEQLVDTLSGPGGIIDTRELRAAYPHLSDEQLAAGIMKLHDAGKVRPYADQTEEQLSTRGGVKIGERWFGTVGRRPGATVTADDLRDAFSEKPVSPQLPAVQQPTPYGPQPMVTRGGGVIRDGTGAAPTPATPKPGGEAMNPEVLLTAVGDHYSVRRDDWANGRVILTFSQPGSRKHRGAVTFDPDGSVTADAAAVEYLPEYLPELVSHLRAGGQPPPPPPGGGTHGTAGQVAARVKELIEGTPDFTAKVVRHRNGDLRVYLSMSGKEKGSVEIRADGRVEVPAGLHKHLLRNRHLEEAIEALRAEPEDRTAWATVATRAATHLDSREPPDDPLERMEWEQARRNPDPLERG